MDCQLTTPCRVVGSASTASWDRCRRRGVLRAGKDEADDAIGCDGPEVGLGDEAGIGEVDVDAVQDVAFALVRAPFSQQVEQAERDRVARGGLSQRQLQEVEENLVLRLRRSPQQFGAQLVQRGPVRAVDVPGDPARNGGDPGGGAPGAGRRVEFAAVGQAQPSA